MILPPFLGLPAFFSMAETSITRALAMEGIKLLTLYVNSFVLVECFMFNCVVCIFELNVDVVIVYNDFKEQGLILAALYGVVCVLFDG